MAEIHVSLPHDLYVHQENILDALNQTGQHRFSLLEDPTSGGSIEMLTFDEISLGYGDLRIMANVIISALSTDRRIDIQFESPRGVKSYEQ